MQKVVLLDRRRKNKNNIDVLGRDRVVYLALCLVIIGFVSAGISLALNMLVMFIFCFALGILALSVVSVMLDNKKVDNDIIPKELKGKL
jgi:NADH:ubiquinone oxidoreductase subunit 6 (subunit J)